MDRTITFAEKMYSAFEKYNSPSEYTRRCINGNIVGCNKCVGYCQFEGHSGFLTNQQRQQHDCIGKECRYYIAKPKKHRYTVSGLKEQINAVLAFAQRTIDVNSGVKVVRVEADNSDKYKAYFVAITNDLHFETYSKVFFAKFNADIEFVRLNYDFETCAALICA